MSDVEKTRTIEQQKALTERQTVLIAGVEQFSNILTALANKKYLAEQ